MAEKKKKNMSFEEALAGLEEMAEILKKDGTTLEDAMASFEQGIEYYNYCSRLLNEAKQKIEVFERSTGLTRPFSTD